MAGLHMRTWSNALPPEHHALAASCERQFVCGAQTKRRVRVPVHSPELHALAIKAGCRERLMRPPDGARLSLEGNRGQAPDAALALFGYSRSGPRFSRAQAPALAAAVVAAVPGRCRSPGSPSRPGRSASPVAAAVAAVVAAEAAEAEAEAEATRSCRSGCPLSSWSDSGHEGRMTGKVHT